MLKTSAQADKAKALLSLELLGSKAVGIGDHSTGDNDPFTVEDQVAIIFAGSKNLLRKVPVNKVKEFERKYIDFLNTKHKKTMETLV
jgi:F0F1-type ATP synthase alpha subunit